MSGFRNRGEGISYWNVVFGSFRRRVKEGSEIGQSRKNKKGETVWEEVHDAFSGHLIGIEKKEGDFGDQWAVKFLADGKEIIINFPYSSRFTNGLLLRLPNMDLAKEITLQGYWFAEDEKSALVVYQEGKKIEPYWSKDERKGLPELEQIKVKGKLQWDTSKQMEYLERYITQKVLPRIEEAKEELVVDTPLDQRKADVDKYDGIDEPPPSKEEIQAAAQNPTPEEIAKEAKRQADEEASDDLPF